MRDAGGVQGVRRATTLALVAAGCLAVVAPAVAETVRLHAGAETRGSGGAQQSRFWAYTTSDEAGTIRVPVSRLCVRAVGHRTQERCVEDAALVEVVEQAEGLPGTGALCVEAFASAIWRETPLGATARACP